MSTAPRDGTEVLVYLGDVHPWVEVMFWAPTIEVWIDRQQTRGRREADLWGWTEFSDPQCPVLVSEAV